MAEFDESWQDIARRCLIVPGKDTLAAINTYLQENYQVTVSPLFIIHCFRRNELPTEMVELIRQIDQFARAVAD